MPFNVKKYNATRKQVLKFLEKNPDATQSIVLKGKEGSGKSRMLNELLPEFESHGYECITHPVSPNRITRSISSGKVFAWYDDGGYDLSKDERFVIFNF